MSDAPGAHGAVLLHLSDTHFGTERPAVVQALLELSERLRPEVAVLSGDVTQRARSGQFESARRFMERLQASAKLVVPGNHDVPLFNLWARCTAPYGGFKQAFGPEVAPSYESDRFLVLSVNTTRAWRHKNGEVSPSQVQAVAARLRSARPGQLRVVVTHQPMAVARAGDRVDLLRGHALAAQAWRDAGADVVVGGHIHLAYVQPLLPAAPNAVRAWVVQAGTAVSSRVRDGLPNSVNVLRRAPPVDGASGEVAGCLLQRYDYDDTKGRFTTAAVQLLPLNGPAVQPPQPPA